MNRKILTSIILFFSVVNIFSQTEDAWIFFKDKPSEDTFISSPIKMLTQRALDRRTRYNIPIDFKDIPVEESYINVVRNSEGISIKAKSKWLNTLHIQGTQIDINSLLSLNFIDRIEYADKSLNISDKSAPKQKFVSISKSLDFTTDFNYGNGANQIEMLNGDVLHQNNFTGEGIQIAIIDAGFPNVNNFAAFKRIRDNNQILGGYDFVNRSTNFYTGSYHGMAVLSTIAGYIDSEFIHLHY